MENTLPPIEDTGPPPRPQTPDPEPMYYYQPPIMPQYVNERPKVDIFEGLEKHHYIICFVVFILGFFMGKTMQPVILKNL